MTRLKHYGELCHKARNIAFKYHKGQKDKAGNDYTEHLLSVSSNFMTQDEYVVSLLHDILEDTPCRAIDLLNYGIPLHLVEAVQTLTRKEGELYFDYIERISKQLLTIRVKLADLRDNLDVSRFSDPSAFSPSLKKRYEKALAILTEAEQLMEDGRTT